MAFLLGLIKGWVTKELLASVFKEVIMETAVDILKEFAEDTENPYDDKLVEHFEAYLNK